MLFRHIGIGEGAEKRVYDDPQNPGLVEKIYRKAESRHTELQMQGMACFNNILHALFTDNIPLIIKTGKKRSLIKGGRDYIEEEKVDFTKDRDYMALKNYTEARLKGRPLDGKNASMAARRIEQNPQRLNFLEQLSQAGIIIDSSPINFAADPEGKLKYLGGDYLPWTVTKDTQSICWNFDLAKLTGYINAQKEPARSQALAGLDELKSLFAMEQQLLNKKS
ncbi:MAG: hypothetical protein M1383_02335 [Patescibacteria group bacterium]|nr:hypothetical protein [Patescibacteria group bacterium]